MPLTPAEEQELAQLQQHDNSNALKDFFRGASPVSSNVLAQVKDRSKMASNPDLQGPRLPNSGTQDEQKLTQDIVGSMAGNFMPAGTANPISYLARRTGLSSIPDKIMQAAVGMKKYIPGIGDNLMEQGVVGTKSMMQNQISNKLQQEAINKDAILGSMSGRIDSGQISNKVKQMADKFSVDGVVPANVRPQTDVIYNTAQDIASRGMVSPRQAGKYAQIAGNIGYQGDKPVERLAGQVARTENTGYRQALENQYTNEFGDQVPNQVQDVYSKLEALVKGKQGLSRPSTIGITPQGGVSLPSLKGLLLGGSTGSVTAHGLNKAGSAVSSAAPRIGAHIAEQQSTQPKQQGLSPEEEAELNTLLSSQ